jgi:PHD/YefM family antitoxin component YafN of YafNO toxin-antitoxin module
MAGQMIQVGVDELRESLDRYLDTTVPLAITRHGQTVGYYVPAQRKIDGEELRKLNEAAEELRALMAEHGITEDEVVREFRARVKGKNAHRGRKHSDPSSAGVSSSPVASDLRG